MTTLWRDDVTIREGEALQDNIKADAVVLGGGMAGILTAYKLKESGLDVVVLEADRIGSGQTQGTTAKITSQHNQIYSFLIQKHGKELAQQYARANEKAIEEYEELINKNKIACDFKRVSSYIYVCGDKNLEAEAEAANSLGLPVCMEEKLKLPFEINEALSFKNQAQFHPLKFLDSISQNLKIYEQSKAAKVEGNKVFTEDGSVTADNIIIATHFPFINIPGYYFMRMHQEQSYVLALDNAMDVEGMYIQAGTGGYSLRNQKDILLFGGQSHRTGEFTDEQNYQKLKEAAKEFFPSCKVVNSWSARDCITVDKVPYIGTFSKHTPNWYVATGFGKWGMSSSMVSAGIIKDKILGNKNDCESVFSPQRLKLRASIPTLLKDGMKAFSGIGLKKLDIPEQEIENIPKKQGGIVEIDGERAGVYKEKDGSCYIVSTSCPHLGCELEWNKEEKTWDCPCHGSRFNYKGELMTGPAMEDLKNEKEK